MKIDRDRRSIRVGGRDFLVEFTQDSAGFPVAIRFPDDPHGACGAVRVCASLEGRGAIRPFMPSFRPEVRKEGDAFRLLFTGLGWQDEAGAVVPGYQLSLQYEIHGDGVVFATAFFNTETTTPGTLRGFLLQPELRLGRGEDARWACWKLPKEMTGKLIQDLGGFERDLPRGAGRRAAGSILPFVAFDFGAAGRRDRHLEFFVESWNSLTLDPANTATDVAWSGRKATVTWDFQRKPATVPGRGYHWRNTWGWCVRRFPVERKPPLRVYHYLDLFERYPSNPVVRKVAEQGANTLILHENWRQDLKNSEFAQDSAALRRVCRACRRHGLRLGLYVRANEDGIREDFARALRPYLRRNRDGIYMDFGSPICFLGREEYAPGGRVHFREYHRMLQRLREFVGPEGFLISHSGSFFAAVGHTLVDAYLGGEQEKGRLIESPSTHAYFSGLSVAPGCLWTAAFPTYRTPRVLPYLAATGQFPFLHLGTQFPSSSLDHPKTPSAIRFARPLWRLWELLDGHRTVRLHTTQNTPVAVLTDGAATGACVFTDGSGDALVIAANFRDKDRRITVRPDGNRTGIALPSACVELQAGESACRFSIAERPVRRTPPLLEREVGPYGLAAWLLVRSLPSWRKRLSRFIRPFPSDPAAEREEADLLSALRQRRFDPPAWPAHYLRVGIPNFACNYEDSVWWDLFDNTIELQDQTRPERPKRLGYLTPSGLCWETPSREDRLWPGAWTPWIDLSGLPGGRRKGPAARVLSLATRRGAHEFYSFVQAELSDAPRRTPRTYEIAFHNAIDLDWSQMSFRIRRSAK